MNQAHTQHAIAQATRGQAVMFDGSCGPVARIPEPPATQPTLFDNTLTGDAAALAERQQIPRVLLTELALAQLDANRQAVIMADLGTGRIVTVAALRKRIKALAQAQATETATAFAWGA